MTGIGDWNIGGPVQWLRRWSRERPDAPFLRCSGGFITYREMEQWSDRTAYHLSAWGLRQGDRIAVLMDNRDEYIVTALAAAKLGAILVPVNKYLKGSFLVHQLRGSGPRVIVTDTSGAAVLGEVLDETPVELVLQADQGRAAGSRSPGADTVGFATIGDSLIPPGVALPERVPGPGDPLMIIYTSGTSGPSKGCLYPTGRIASRTALNEHHGFIIGGDRLFGVLPFFHGAGLVHSVYSPLRHGDSTVIAPEFHASTYIGQAMAAEATMLMGIGAVGAAVLAQPRSQDPAGASFRFAWYAPLIPAQQAEFKERFRCEVSGGEGYGQTECDGITSSAIDGWRKPGTIGRPSPHMEVGLVDEDDNEVAVGAVGEIVARPRLPYTMFLGYWNDPAATLRVSRNLWHHTGDLGRADADGFITFVDRKSDSLRRRGENISSVEVETAILAHPDVRSVAVHGVPSDLGEDEVKAVIVSSAAVPLAPAELFQFFAAHLPYYAIPRYVEFVTEMPVTAATGRVRKQVLRERGVTEQTWDFTALGLTVGRADRRAATSQQ